MASEGACRAVTVWKNANYINSKKQEGTLDGVKTRRHSGRSSSLIAHLATAKSPVFQSSLMLIKPCMPGLLLLASRIYTQVELN